MSHYVWKEKLTWIQDAGYWVIVVEQLERAVWQILIILEQVLSTYQLILFVEEVNKSQNALNDESLRQTTEWAQ